MKNKTRKVTALMAALVMMLCAMSAGAEDAVNVILTSGTTQAFTADAVSEEDLTTILQAGLRAASAINQQPWYFVALTNREMMDEISASGGMPAGAMPAGAEAPAGALPEGFEASAGMPAEGAEGSEAPAAPVSTGAKASLGDSPVAILVYRNDGTKSPNADFDCGLACQNMVIAANALGYGVKIVSSTTNALNGENHDALCEKLGVDPSMTAVAVLLIGYRDDAVDGSSGATTRNDMDTMVSFVR